MRIFLDTDVDAATVALEVPAPGENVVLRDDVIAIVDHGRLTAVELLNVSQHGDPFDEAAATRVLEWVRGLLAARVAS